MFLLRADGRGAALTIINTRSVIEALVGYQTGFARTLRYAIGGDKQAAGQEQRAYRSRSGWLPYAFETWRVGAFFLWMVIFAIESYNFLAIPFLLLFVGGYFWAGGSTLWEEYQGKLEWQRQRELAERAEA